MKMLVKVVKVLFILGFLLVCFGAWAILTPWSYSDHPEVKRLLKKTYRTKVPLVIFDDAIESTSTVQLIYGPGNYDILPVGSLVYLRRVESIPMNGSRRSLSVIKSPGPYEGRKVDAEDLWVTAPVTVSSSTGKVSTEYLEEVPDDHL